MRDAMRSLVRRFGLWRCRRGHHAPLEWLRAKDRPALPTNAAQEMMYAAGLASLAKWNGWCPRCLRAVEWASFDPRRAGHNRAVSRIPRSTPFVRGARPSSGEMKHGE